MKHLSVFLILIAVTCAPVPAQRFESDRISVTTRGTGPDVILIGGLSAHREVWNDVAETLDDRYRLHLVQVNGFGGLAAGANAEGPVVAPSAEEIARYITTMRLERPAVIGHSLGGSIGLMLAARHPDLAGRVMVVDMTPNLGAAFAGPNPTPEAVRASADQFRAQMLSQPLDSPDSVLQQSFAGMTRSDAKRPILQRHLSASDRHVVANAMHELLVTDLRPELTRITVPVTVLYVVPTNVQMTPAQFDEVMRASYSNLRGVRLIRIDDSNHFIFFDQPARFVTEVDAFMR